MGDGHCSLADDQTISVHASHAPAECVPTPAPEPVRASRSPSTFGHHGSAGTSRRCLLDVTAWRRMLGMKTTGSSPSQHLSVPFDPLDHVVGPAHGALVVVEYGDFECPSCAQAYPAVKILMERFEHRFRFVYRHFPLTEVHPHAQLAAEAAEAAGAQGRFWEMHDRLFEHQRHQTAPDLLQHAQALALDTARFEAELADHVHLQRVQEHIASGVASRVRSTPGFFVGGVRVDTSFGLQSLADAIARDLEPR
jgi:protein-disulfide isomerase